MHVARSKRKWIENTFVRIQFFDFSQIQPFQIQHVIISIRSVSSMETRREGRRENARRRWFISQHRLCDNISSRRNSAFDRLDECSANEREVSIFSHCLWLNQLPRVSRFHARNRRMCNWTPIAQRTEIRHRMRRREKNQFHFSGRFSIYSRLFLRRQNKSERCCWCTNFFGSKINSPLLIGKHFLDESDYSKTVSCSMWRHTQ